MYALLEHEVIFGNSFWQQQASRVAVAVTDLLGVYQEWMQLWGAYLRLSAWLFSRPESQHRQKWQRTGRCPRLDDDFCCDKLLRKTGTRSKAASCKKM